MVKSHLIIIPHPLQGHITPAFHLATKLSSPPFSFSISFLLPHHSSSLIPPLSPPNPLLTLVGLPDGLPPLHPRRSTFLDSYQMILGLQPAVELYLRDLARQRRHVTCIVADTFVSWAHDVASQFGIPRFLFATTNATALRVMSYMSTLVSRGVLPFKIVDGTSKFSEEPISCIPGVLPIRPRDFPESMRSPSISHYRLQFIKKQFEHVHEAAGVLVNTFYEIESRVIEEMRQEFPVFAIGPTLLLNGKDTSSTGIEVPLWPEENDCLQWLDTQAPASVIYISFGSMAHQSLEQLRELALGLEASEQFFLWTICPGSIDKRPISEVLPEGFEDRTKGRGMVVSWISQKKVLSHSAIGGFLTHCGWNSIMENISLGGVPMICWPLAAEQNLNCRLIVDEWKIGLEVVEANQRLVGKEEVEKAVRALMQGEEEMRERAVLVSHRAHMAMEEGGSSLRNMEAFLHVAQSKELATA